MTEDDGLCEVVVDRALVLLTVSLSIQNMDRFFLELPGLDV